MPCLATVLCERSITCYLSEIEVPSLVYEQLLLSVDRVRWLVSQRCVVIAVCDESGRRVDAPLERCN